MVTRTNLTVDIYCMLDLAGPFIIYSELRITSQVSAAENGGIYHILMDIAYVDDILGVFIFNNMLSSINGGV